VQQLALVAALAQARRQAAKETADRDWRNFVLAGIAAHPESARQWLRLLKRDEDDEAPEEDDGVPEDYVPVQDQPDLQEKIRQLQTLGFAMVED